MKNRPWPIVVLAMIQFVTPVVNLALSAWLARTNLTEYTMNLITLRPWYEVADFFGIYLVAGTAIFMMKKWSYPVFLFGMGWISYSNTEIWLRDYAGTPFASVFLLISAVNICLVTYYLLPAVRKVYFDKRLRWWESKPRYLIDIDASLSLGKSQNKCRLSNISEGGALLEKVSKEFTHGDEVVLKFNIYNLEVSVPSKVVHQNKNSVGIEYQHLGRVTRNKVKRVIKVMQLLDQDLTRNPDPWYVSFLEWLGNLIQTGEGWVPEIPEQYMVLPDREEDDPEPRLRLIKGGAKSKTTRSSSKQKKSKAA